MITGSQSQGLEINMILAKIKNKDIESTFQFNSETELNEKLLTGIWGKPHGLYPMSQLTPEELAQEISRVTEDNLGDPLLDPLIEIPAQYTIEITDITAEVEAIARKEKSRFAIQLAMEIMSEIRDLNVQKNMSQAEFVAMMSDVELEKIERHIWTGSFKTAKYYVENYTGQIYTTEDKIKIVELLDSAILKVG